MSDISNNLKNYEGRWKHLYKLWRSSLVQESLPQMDRWLAQEFAKSSKYGSRDRRWYSEGIFAGIRYGYFAVFCEEFFKYSLINNDYNKIEFQGFIQNFKKKYSNSNEILSSFRDMSEERFFTWIRLRYLNLNYKFSENISFEFKENNFIDEKNIFDYINHNLKENDSLLAKMIMQSIPLWFSEYIEKRILVSNWDENQIEQFFILLESRPPMWLRLNDAKYLKDILTELENNGYKAEIFDENTLKVIEGKGGIFALNTFRSGYFEIQDLASQQIGQHVEAKMGQFVWDSCAGGGGKTQQIASYLKNKGVIYASDIREYKLEELKKRSKKSGFFNIRCVSWNGEGLPKFQREIENNKGFDWVLIDAPCSSSGTWRRNPDSKYRATKENLKSLCDLQLKILQTASCAVRPLGNLVYSTCSWIYDENENIIEQFLSHNSNFTLEKQVVVGSPLQNADTMFVAVLKKISD
ncbi:RsmB/NOP family class I SAM-dependent RNA methyltransferase [Silvanigrella aquatica]|uniref:SAM-dependent MTase RsmB/NOP-type domain-containing protein n=1 Tax=Silvanigrella aquatica TaxID=1915309 RepID=A0A1L4D3Q1_9BACT|nr:RsmB/NOP family class I SAM-dependent RNA methyltransferase [Silvanigrella aquatica]APJ04810.1 hypothetical protein AXG55_13245 [Silvanigrella aquatica]